VPYARRVVRGVSSVAVALAAAGVPGAALVPPVAASAPACTEVSNPPGEPIIDPAATAPFGPLAVEPALRVATSAPLWDADSVPGGVIVTTGAETGPTALTLVEDSGAERWTRCVEAAPWSVNVLAGVAAEQPTQVLVGVASEDIGAGLTLEGFDLATGDATPFGPGAARTPLFLWDESAGHALFGPSLEAVELSPGSELTLVTLATLATTSIATAAVPADVTFPSYRLGDAGVVGLGGRAGVDSSIALVYVDGGWSADPEVIDASFPVWTDYDSRVPVSYHRASGPEAWSIAGVYAPSDEGFHDAFVSGVELIRGCTEVVPDTGICDAAVLLGVDADTGTELWRRGGNHGVAAAADGFAIVSAPTDDSGENWTQSLIDVTTGAPIEGQTWPEVPFLIGCCGEPVFTVVDGGVVLTSDGTGVDVYVPVAAATPTVDVTL
jgi:hypothetical protein